MPEHTTATISLPAKYLAYVDHLAERLAAAGMIVTDGQSAVLIAALNVLARDLNRITATTQEEERWRLEALANLSQAQSGTLKR